MTPELEEKLAKETERQLDYVANLTVESEAYYDVMEEIRKNCTVLTNELKVNNEAEKGYEERRIQQELEQQKMQINEQIEKQKLDEQQKAHKAETRAKIGEYVVNGAITVGTAVLTGVIYVAMFKAGLEFEEGNSITSLFFKNFLGKLRPN